MFKDPAWAQPRLREASVRWRESGQEVRSAWALANAGVASFNLSRMADAVADLEGALAIFERHDEVSATVAVSSFLCLAKPTDRRVPEWLAGALSFADESGDRTKQVAALTSLAWHHFLRSLWGGPADTATAERLALRLAEVAEDLGAIEPAIQARSLLAIMARLSGRIQPAATQTKLLARAPRTRTGTNRGLAGLPASAVARPMAHPMRLRPSRRRPPPTPWLASLPT